LPRTFQKRVRRSLPVPIRSSLSPNATTIAPPQITHTIVFTKEGFMQRDPMYAIATRATITTTYASESAVRGCVIRNGSLCPAN
jgi:hypothetical protein